MVWNISQDILIKLNSSKISLHIPWHYPTFIEVCKHYHSINPRHRSSASFLQNPTYFLITPQEFFKLNFLINSFHFFAPTIKIFSLPISSFLLSHQFGHISHLLNRFPCMILNIRHFTFRFSWNLCAICKVIL